MRGWNFATRHTVLVFVIHFIMRVSVRCGDFSLDSRIVGIYFVSACRVITM